MSVSPARLRRDPPASLSNRPPTNWCLTSPPPSCILGSRDADRIFPPGSGNQIVFPYRFAYSNCSVRDLGNACKRQSCQTEKCFTKMCSSRHVGAWSPELCSPSKRRFQSLRADDCPCDGPGHRGHTASTLLSVQQAFLALPGHQTPGPWPVSPPTETSAPPC